MHVLVVDMLIKSFKQFLKYENLKKRLRGRVQFFFLEKTTTLSLSFSGKKKVVVEASFRTPDGQKNSQNYSFGNTFEIQ